MPALAHAARCRPQGASLKVSDDLFRAAGSFDNSHRYSTRPERFHGARADSAAQYRLTIPQHLDKSGVSVTFGGAIARMASVLMTACIGAGLDEFYFPIPGFEDEKLAAAPKMSGNVDSIVRWYCNLHMRFSLVTDFLE
jgi:hypothetical protein